MTQEPMALDIETTGLGPLDRITCICVASNKCAWTWTMGLGYNHEVTREQLQWQLDGASRIYVYNGASFDIPFIQRFFQYTDETVGKWMAKLVDPLYAARALLGYEACPKLNEVLALNGINAKTGSGADAITMARENRWKELADYCMNDTMKTFELLDRKEVNWTNGLVYSWRSKHTWIKDKAHLDQGQ